MSHQHLSRSSLHRLVGILCRIFLSYDTQVVTCKVLGLLWGGWWLVVDVSGREPRNCSHIVDYLYDLYPPSDPNVGACMRCWACLFPCWYLRHSKFVLWLFKLHENKDPYTMRHAFETWKSRWKCGKPLLCHDVMLHKSYRVWITSSVRRIRASAAHLQKPSSCGCKSILAAMVMLRPAEWRSCLIGSAHLVLGRPPCLFQPWMFGLKL